MIKKLCVLFILISNVSGFAQWTGIFSAPGNPAIVSLNYTGDSAIFVASPTGLIYSANDGATFNSLSSFTTTPVNSSYATRSFVDASFITKDTGIIGGFINNNNVYQTFAQEVTGNFANWQLTSPVLNLPTASEIIAVKYFSAGRIYLLDNAANLYVSYNNGTSWQFKNTFGTPYNVSATGMSFSDSLHGYFTTLQGNYLTNDAGQTIVAANALPGGFIAQTVKFISATTGFIIGRTNNSSQFELFRTLDGGVTWSDMLQQPVSDQLTDVSFISKDTGFVISSSYILNTNDGGSTWFIIRMSNISLRKIDFIKADKGVMAGITSGGATQLFKYNAAAASHNPFVLFSFQTNYCCSGMACNIINYGPSNLNYKWYVNDSLVSTAFTPAGLILPPGSGYNTIKLVSSNGLGVDSTTQSIQNVAPVSISPTINFTCYDTTVCLGQGATFYALQTNYGINYFVSDSSGPITSIQSGTGNTISLYTNPLNLSDTLLHVTAQTQYPACPGNVFHKNQRMVIYTLPPNNIMSLIRDSICTHDSVKVLFNPSIAGTTYTVFPGPVGGGSGPIGSASSSVGGSLTAALPPIVNSESVFYYSTDQHGCQSLASTPLKVKVDSTWAKIYTSIPASYIGDTLTVVNQSVATQFNWSFAAGTQVISTTDTVVKLKYATPGDYYVNLRTDNKTGCKDSIFYKTGAYQHMQQGPGTLCFSDTTAFDSLSMYSGPSPNYGFNNYMRLHVDSKENYYITRNVQNIFYEGYYADFGAIGFKITKYDAAGNQKWTVQPDISNLQIGPYGSGNNVYFNSTINTIASDREGNIYFGGNFSGSHLKIGSQNCIFSSSSNPIPDFYNTPNSYAAKLDSNGVCQWIMGFMSLGSEVSSAITLNYKSIGAVYLHTTGVNQIVQTSGAISNMPVPAFDDALITIADNGYIESINYLWNDPGQTSYGCMNEFCSETGYEVYLDQKMLRYKHKLIHVNTTRANNGINFANQQYLANDSAGYYTYVAITDTLGNLINVFRPVRFYGVGSYYNPNQEFDFSPKYALDKDGYLYFSWGNISILTSSYYKSNLYNNLNYRCRLANDSLIELTDAATQLIKYDLNGNVIWSRTQNDFHTNSLIANNDGNIYGLGEFFNLAGFQSSNHQNQMITGNDTCMKALLYSYDKNGNFLWGKPFNSAHNQYPKEITVKDTCNNELYFAVGFDTSASFMGSTLPDNRTLNIYKMSVGNACTSVYCPDFQTGIKRVTDLTNGNLISIMPNPTQGMTSLYATDTESMHIKLYNNQGKLILDEVLIGDTKYTLNLSEQTAGIYFLWIEQGNLVQKEKIIVIK